MVTYVRETVTPQGARQLLDKSDGFKNRALTRAWVRTLSEAIRSGTFSLHYAPILIDVNGFVIDGQHRLHAIVESGCEVELTIAHNVPTHAFAHADIVKPRKASDVLGIIGVRNYTQVATALSWVEAYEQEKLSIGYGWVAIAPYRVSESLEAHPGIDDCVSFAGRVKSLASVGMVGGLLYLFREKDSVLADTFIDAVATGMNGTAGDPAWELHRRLVENRIAKRRARPIEVAAWFVKSWNHLRAGTKIKILRWRTVGPMAERFPVVK